jgi:hypothetical protein
VSEPSAIDEVFEELERQAQIDKSCLDARRTASILAAFYLELQDQGMSGLPLDQISIIYARKLLKMGA